jgi:hypothetical protein
MALVWSRYLKRFKSNSIFKYWSSEIQDGRWQPKWRNFSVSLGRSISIVKGNICAKEAVITFVVCTDSNQWRRQPVRLTRAQAGHSEIQPGPKLKTQGGGVGQGGRSRGRRPRGSRREAPRGEGSGEGARAPSPATGVRGCHPRKFLKSYMQICAFWCILASKQLTLESSLLCLATC